VTGGNAGCNFPDVERYQLDFGNDDPYPVFLNDIVIWPAARRLCSAQRVRVADL
jgi:hypothetical protein